MFCAGASSCQISESVIRVCFCVSCAGTSGEVQLGAGFQVVLTGFILCVINRCKWSGTAGGRISGCVDKVCSVCYLQV